MYKTFEPDIKLRFYSDFLVDINWKTSALAQPQVIAFFIFVCLFVYQASEQAGASTITAKAVPSSFIYAQHCQYGEVHPGRWTKISAVYIGMLKNKGGCSNSTVFKLVIRICMNVKSNYVMCNCYSCSHLLTLSCLSVLICSWSI